MVWWLVHAEATRPPPRTIGFQPVGRRANGPQSAPSTDITPEGTQTTRTRTPNPLTDRQPPKRAHNQRRESANLRVRPLGRQRTRTDPLGRPTASIGNPTPPPSETTRRVGSAHGWREGGPPCPLRWASLQNQRRQGPQTSAAGGRGSVQATAGRASAPHRPQAATRVVFAVTGSWFARLTPSPGLSATLSPTGVRDPP